MQIRSSERETPSSYFSAMRFEEERVACSMVRGEKEFKAAAAPLGKVGVVGRGGMDYSVGRTLCYARFVGGIMARGWREFAIVSPWPLD